MRWPRLPGRRRSQDRPRPSLSVRARVVASVVLMSAPGLATAGAVANAIQTARISDQIDSALALLHRRTRHWVDKVLHLHRS